MSDETAVSGPVDYVIIEWSDGQPDGKALPHLIDLVDRGLVRIIDLAFVTKSEEGVVTAVNLDQLGVEFEVFNGASSNLLDDGDFAEAANAIEPGSSAAILLWENLWAAPLAGALRGAGAQIVARGAVPIDALLETLEIQ